MSFPFKAAFKPLIPLAAKFDFFNAVNASVPAVKVCKGQMKG